MKHKTEKSIERNHWNQKLFFDMTGKIEQLYAGKFSKQPSRNGHIYWKMNYQSSLMENSVTEEFSFY